MPDSLRESVTPSYRDHSSLWRTIDAGAAELHPAYFALVMATGIVSIAGYLQNMDLLAWSLFYLNQVFYVVLWLFMLLRVSRHFSRVRADLANHSLGAGFFTLVAATNVLGSQFFIFASNQRAARLLWILGLVLWIVLIYAFFALMTVKEQKPALDAGINGAWLVTVVATQSVAALGALVASRLAAWQDELFFAVLCFYLFGCMLYLLVISLIFYRFMFFKLDPLDLTPPYWINMGAVAITTLAGASIILHGDTPLVADLLPFVKGFTLFYWATATWWIPLLIILGGWRHVVRRHRVAYHPLYWGLVFPLGMYTVCTYQLATALQLDFLYAIPRIFVYLAIVAWLAAFVGLTMQLTKKLLPRRGSVTT